MENYYSKNEKTKLMNLNEINSNNIITKEKLDKYFSITAEALTMIDEKGIDETKEKLAKDFLLMANSYFNDAKHFAFEKKDFVLAFGALNYAHAWLDAGARQGLFKVNDSRLFTVDD